MLGCSEECAVPAKGIAQNVRNFDDTLDVSTISYKFNCRVAREALYRFLGREEL